MTESAQNADFRRKPQIFADSPLLLKIPGFGGRRKPQKTADFRRKPKIFAENRRKPQIGLRHLRCVTFSSALLAPLHKSLSSKSHGKGFVGWGCFGMLTTRPKTITCLVSDYSATGDTISCAMPPLLALSLDCDRPFLVREVKTVLRQASAWDRFWRDFLEVWGVPKQTS